MFNYESINLVNENEKKVKKMRESKKLRNKVRKLIKKVVIKKYWQYEIIMIYYVCKINNVEGGYIMTREINIIKYLYSEDNGLTVTTYYKVVDNNSNTIIEFTRSNFDELLEYLSDNRYIINKFINDTMM